MRAFFSLTLVILFAVTLLTAQATTLPPELKAYDFAEGYSLSDEGLLIVPYPHGFHTTSGKNIPGGLLLQPGDQFLQYDPSRMICDEYQLLRVNRARAFLHQVSYRYRVETDSHGKTHYRRGLSTGTGDFYLTRFRSLKPFDQVFTDIELHPGAQAWRTRQN